MALHFNFGCYVFSANKQDHISWTLLIRFLIPGVFYIPWGFPVRQLHHLDFFFLICLLLSYLAVLARTFSTVPKSSNERWHASFDHNL